MLPGSKKSVRISVPSPCHENWDAMTPSEQGRLCNACQKIVIDFAIMEDKEIIRYFAAGKNVCGRFRTDQLDRNLQAASRKEYPLSLHLFKKMTAVLLLCSSLTTRVFAQQKKNPGMEMPASDKKNDTGKPIIVSGRLLELKTNTPLSGITVSLHCDTLTLQAKTNGSGWFSFRVPVLLESKIAILHTDTRRPDAFVPDKEVMISHHIQPVFLYQAEEKIVEKITNVDPSRLVLIAREERTTGIPVRTVGDISSLRRSKRKAQASVAQQPGSSFWYRMFHPFKKGN